MNYWSNPNDRCTTADRNNKQNKRQNLVMQTPWYWTCCMTEIWSDHVEIFGKGKNPRQAEGEDEE